MDSKEIQKLIDSRRAEAAQKNLNKKLRLIAKTLGFPMYQSYGSSSSGFSSTDLSPTTLGIAVQNSTFDKFWERDMELEEDLSTIDLNESLDIYGYYYDMLSNGTNLQISYNERSENVRVDHDGYIVYEEIEGQVMKYTPSEKWEIKIDSLFRHAEKKIIMNAKTVKKEQTKMDKKKFMDKILDYLSTNWGYK